MIVNVVKYYIDLLFYLVYASIKGPSVRVWYNKFWFSLSKKDLANNAFSMLLTLICTEFLFLILKLLNLNFKVVVFTSMGSTVLFSILFLFIVVPKKYTHTKIKLVEERFKDKIKRWQAVIYLIIIFNVLLFGFYSIIITL